MISEHIKVFLRQRPTIASDAVSTSSSRGSTIEKISNDRKKCGYYSASNGLTLEFNVEKFFADSDTQEELYVNVAKPLIESALLGYSGTIFAYGPTCSGKTYTMRGGNDNLKGIMPRCVEHLLQEIAVNNNKSTIWISYMQIYCEKVTDLLSADASSDVFQQLSIREKSGSVYVEGLSKFQISTLDDFWEVISRGDQRRNTASTNANETSSRSHATLMITVMIPDEIANSASATTAQGTHRESTLMLVDLAGSERATASDGRDYMRLEEAKSINLSLSALGNCMSALADGRTHIPYRDSKLTRLLQGCLGGSSRTAVIVNIPPGEDTTGEILSALRFAARASKVAVNAKVNRCKDYESMYLETKKMLESMEQAKSNVIHEKSLQNELKNKDLVIESQAMEIAALRQRILSYQTSSKPLTVVDSENPSQIDGATSQKISDSNEILQNQLHELAIQHATKVESMTRTFQAKISQLVNAEKEQSIEILALRDELALSQQTVLAAMQDQRLMREKKSKDESSLKGRVEELLQELNEAHSTVDTLKETVSGLESKNTALAQSYQSLQESSKEMVTREQVKEMENLFVDTVTKLSNRVNFLESQKESQKGGSGGGSTSQTSIGSNGSSSRHQQQPNQPSNNNNSRIRIEPGGKIRAVSMNGMNQFDL